MNELEVKKKEYVGFNWGIMKCTELYTDGITPDQSVVEGITTINNYTLDSDRFRQIDNELEVLGE